MRRTTGRRTAGRRTATGDWTTGRSDRGALDYGALDYGASDHGALDRGGLDHWDPSDGGPGSDGFAAWRNGLGTPNGNGTNGTGYSNGNGNGHSPLDVPTPPAFSPAPSSQVDELFGPLLDLPLEPIDDRYATPIFEAIASAWFREGDGDSGADRAADPQRGPTDWETPQDSEWREAAARAARSEPTPTTASGLPRRRPGNQLVPPPRAQSGLPSGGPGERVPDRVPATDSAPTSGGCARAATAPLARKPRNPRTGDSRSCVGDRRRVPAPHGLRP